MATPFAADAIEAGAARRAARFEPYEPAAGRAFVAEPLPGRGAEPAAAREPEPPPPDLEALWREAYDAGHAAGRAELPWQEAEALRSAAAALGAAAQALASLRRSQLLESRRAVVELACAIAERILGGALESRPDPLAALVARAAELFDEDEPLVVHLASADRATLEACDATLAAFKDESRLRLAVDPRLAPGEARVEAPSGDVRVSVADALERVRLELAEAFDAPGPDPATGGDVAKGDS